MKNFIKLCTIVFCLIIFMSYVLLYQSNDVMLMKHWIELIIIEGFVQEALYLLKNNKIIIKKDEMKKFGLIALAVLCLTAVVVWAQVNTKSTNNLKNCVELKHKGYSTMYDTVLKYPVLVHWVNTKNRVECGSDKLARKDKFAPDPHLYQETNLEKDYVGSGYDRGHMCPAADNECDADELVECFYFSNMAPQPHATNAGDWKSVEEQTRQLTLANDSVYVWCGSFGIAKKFGVHNVAVPTKCWKVIYVVKTKTYLAYIMDNTFDKPVGMAHWAVKVPDVEKLTGFTFKP